MSRWVVPLLLLAAGCRCDSKPDPAPVASASKAETERPPERPKRSGMVRACRVLGLQGEARFAGKPLENGARVDGSDFIEVSAGARVTLKFDLTGRELTVIGPALARGCNQGDSVLALSHGTLETARGAGTRPGVEGGIATPALALTYGDARLRITAGPEETSVEVLQGEATLLGEDEQAEGKKLVPGKPTKVKGTAKLEPRLEACSKQASRSAELAADVLRSRAASMRSATPLAKNETFAKVAAEHVRSRRAARMRCAMALASAGNLPAEERDAALAKVTEADDLWRRLRQPR